MASLVYHAGALGDFIAALPALAAWRRQRAGGGPVVLLGRPAHAALAVGVIDESWDAGSARFASLFAGRPSPGVRALLAGIGSALVFAPDGAGIVRRLESLGETDIPSKTIGEIVMESLARIDTVAYVRFASVYKNFQTADDFDGFVSELRPGTTNEE